MDAAESLHPIPSARFLAYVTRDAGEVREAQRLRYEVYRDALGVGRDDDGRRLDIDPFDEFCEHLVARDTATGAIVGTYRILSDTGARKAGGFYSATEFQLYRVESERTARGGRARVSPPRLP